MTVVWLQMSNSATVTLPLVFFLIILKVHNYLNSINNHEVVHSAMLQYDCSYHVCTLEITDQLHSSSRAEGDNPYFGMCTNWHVYDIILASLFIPVTGHIPSKMGDECSNSKLSHLLLHTYNCVNHRVFEQVKNL